MPKKEEMIFKTFRTEVRAVDDKEGVIDMLIPMSTGSIDRHGESIDPKGWKKSLAAFKKRAILLSTHGYSDLRKQIGELLELKIVPEGLLAKPKYYIDQGNEEADWGFKLASKGKAAYSVGFIPIKWEDSDGKDGKPTRTFTEQELLEISHVIVPSNRDAIQQLRSISEDPVMNKVIDDVLGEDGLIEIGDEEGEVMKFEEVEKPYPNEHACRLRDPKKFKPDSFRRIPRTSDGKKYWVIMGRLKGETTLTEQAYRYNKDVWTVAQAKKHCKDHEGILFEPATGKEKEGDKPEKEPKEGDSYTKKIKEILPELSVDGADFILGLLKDRNELQDEVDELKEKVKELELEIQEVSDPSKKGEGEGDSETGDKKDDKDDNTILELDDSKSDDEPKGEEKDEGTIEIDEKVVDKVIEERMGYILGKVKKDPIQK